MNDSILIRVAHIGDRLSPPYLFQVACHEKVALEGGVREIVLGYIAWCIDRRGSCKLGVLDCQHGVSPPVYSADHTLLCMVLLQPVGSDLPITEISDTAVVLHGTHINGHQRTMACKRHAPV